VTRTDPKTFTHYWRGLLRKILRPRVTRASIAYVDIPARAQARAFEQDGLNGGDSPRERNHAVCNLLWGFLRNEQGVTAIEYGLLAAGIAVAIIAVVAALGTQLNATFTTVSTSLK